MTKKSDLLKAKISFFKLCLYFSLSLWVASFGLYIFGGLYTLTGVILGATTFVTNILFAHKLKKICVEAKQGTGLSETVLVGSGIFIFLLIFFISAFAESFGNY